MVISLTPSSPAISVIVSEDDSVSRSRIACRRAAAGSFLEVAGRFMAQTRCEFVVEFLKYKQKTPNPFRRT
jgi:hypothetical protein